MMTKPPYRVPTMQEICSLPWNGFNAISTFSGGGGSSTGYRMAGFRVLWASEFIDSARETYAANKAPYTVLDGRDIRQVKAEDILDAIDMKPGELDLFDGSPPCASFSTAGKREAGWGKVKKYSDKAQRTDDLFFEFSRLVRGVQPKVFVAENVSGLVKGTAKGYFLEILRELKSCGYRVACKVLDSQWLGVPQMRQRTIFVGVREDLGIEPAHPKPLPYRYTLQDASVATIDTVYKTVQASAGARTSSSWTHGTCQHPTEKRKFTIAELKQICGFPPDYILAGTYAQQWERCGRAVPPVMMMHIAAAIRDNVLARTVQ